MTSERIKEIQQQTAYPDSVSVQQALLQVWNDISQTEISDEEIEKAAKEWYDKKGIVNYKAEIRAWISACKWYREQLKKNL